MSTTFFQRAVRGDFGDDPERISVAMDDAIEAWHLAEPTDADVDIYTWLGMTPTQYAHYVQNTVPISTMVFAARATKAG